MNISDEDLQKVVGGDGTLPGGMPPDMLQKLMTNPELMALLQSPKMQEAMKLMMTDGQEVSVFYGQGEERDREIMRGPFFGPGQLHADFFRRPSPSFRACLHISNSSLKCNARRKRPVLPLDPDGAVFRGMNIFTSGA